MFAHPDDETLVGPLLASQARRGAKVHLAIVTEGDKGTQAHAGIPAGQELARVRAEEARCSARALGIEPPVLLGFKDGELGRMARPSWGPLAEVEAALARLMSDLRPDVVVTFGPEGAYGHPDHRLVGAVVTQLVQKGADGAPAVLLYPGFPSDRLPPPAAGGLPWSPTAARFLTVRVPYRAEDMAASRAALACHQTQFRPDQIQALPHFMERVLGGEVYLRPWFGTGGGDPFAPDPR
ncbi:MAG TPA: PIG-L family deacetylase [Vicinamibacteria bacterium]|nr:PIG-L family deacetylase [Vicinamibacteria bacterium]